MFLTVLTYGGDGDSGKLDCAIQSGVIVNMRSRPLHLLTRITELTLSLKIGEKIWIFKGSVF